MCKTKPIRNQRKVHCRLGLNCPCPSFRVENEAKGRDLTLHAPRFTLHASPPQWPVDPEGVASGEGRRLTLKTANPSAASRRKRRPRPQKRRKTKPIRNQRKDLCRLRLNRRRRNRPTIPFVQ